MMNQLHLLYIFILFYDFHLSNPTRTFGYHFLPSIDSHFVSNQLTPLSKEHTNRLSLVKHINNSY